MEHVIVIIIIIYQIILFLTKTQAAMYVKRNNEARLCNHCCSGIAISITQPVCVFVALGIQPAMRMRHIAICGLSSSALLLHVISQTAQFFRKKKLLNGKCVF
jgi:hypothetical protein